MNDQVGLNRTSRRPRRAVLAAACMSFAIAVSGAAQAAPRSGSLDTSFDGDGKRVIGFGPVDIAAEVLQQADGRLVIAGSTTNLRGRAARFSLARLLPNGRLDNSFSGDGKVTIDPTTGEDGLVSAALQPNGKVVALGVRTDRRGRPRGYVLVRHRSDGRIDSSFGRNGRVLGGAGESAADLGVQGKRLLVLTFGEAGLAVDRYNENGGRDRSFGRGGRATVAEPLIGTTLTVQRDGKIVVAGIAASGEGVALALVRFNANGRPDTRFGRGGVALFPTASDEVLLPADVLVQPNRSIAVGGSLFRQGAGGDPEIDFAVLRFRPNGAADRSFGRRGRAVTEIQGDDFGLALEAQPGGKLVLVGFAGDLSDAEPARMRTLRRAARSAGVRLPRLVASGGGEPVNDTGGVINLALARYTARGVLDGSFGARGKVITKFDGPSVGIGAVVQRDGAIVAAGARLDARFRTADFAVARYNK